MSSPQYPYPPQPPPPCYAPPPPQPDPSSSLKIAIAVGAIVASLAANAFLLYEVHDMKTESAQTQEKVQNQIEAIKAANTEMTEAYGKHFNDLKQDLATSKHELSFAANQAASQVKKEALSYADEQSRKLEAEQAQTKQQLSSSISDVNQKAETVNAKVEGVNNDVAGVCMNRSTHIAWALVKNRIHKAGRGA